MLRLLLRLAIAYLVERLFIKPESRYRIRFISVGEIPSGSLVSLESYMPTDYGLRIGVKAVSRWRVPIGVVLAKAESQKPVDVQIWRRNV